MPHELEATPQMTGDGEGFAAARHSLREPRAVVAQRIATGACPAVLPLDVVAFRAARVVVVHGLFGEVERACLGHLRILAESGRSK
jgi:hypothetical protein